MSREHPLALHRILPAAVILILGIVTLAAVKGPDWYQRIYHPLRYQTVIAERSRDHGLDPYLVAALINVESGFDTTEVSGKGAVGLMQLMPSTAREVARDNDLGVSPDTATLKDPATNIRIGTLYLSDLTRRYETLEEALTAYNAGASNTNRWRRTAKEQGTSFRDAIEYPETRRHLADVLEQREIYVRLYPGAFEAASR